ncbi:MAG: hypothetical protein JXR19_07620 [Bacteroidia bacterium]
MRKLSAFIIFSCLLSTVLFSCKSEEETPDVQETTPFVSYKFDGVEVVMDNVVGRRLLTTVPDLLTVQGSLDPSGLPRMYISTYDDSADLKDGRSVIANKANIFKHQAKFWDITGKEQGTVYDSTELKIDYSKIEYFPGGVVSGTFSGVIRDGSKNEYTISDGKFHVIVEN